MPGTLRAAVRLPQSAMTMILPAAHRVTGSADWLRVGGRGAARAMLVAVAVALLVVMLGGGTKGDGGSDACVQRVKAWSPSLQTYVLRVQSFCD